ncbi:MAG: PAS domain-containing protein, partial [Deltaproteobacteria bacterium]|nr:PAS domain-containing protein [Deltaproteobacteria bacterium]
LTELETLNNKLRKTEENLWKCKHDLDEQAKELNLFYAISRLVDKPDISLDEVYQGTVDLMPSAWQYPEITCARVIIEDQEFKTNNSVETIWKQSSKIIAQDNRIGTLEVCYLEEKPESDEGPFLKEERYMINAIAERLGKITEQKWAEKMLVETEKKYHSLTDDVLDTSKVGIFILDSDFRVVWVNQALGHYFGIRREEVLDKDKRQLIREQIKNIFEDPEGFSEKVLATYDNNTYVENFACHVLPDGDREERWLQHWSQPIRNGLYAGGRIEHYTDISERKQGEEERARIDARLQDKVTELSIMNAIGEVLLSTRELDEILHMILIGVTAYQALGFNRAFLFLINEEATMLEGEVATGSLTPEEAYKIWERLAQEKHTLKELLESRHGELSKEDEPINNLVKQMKILLTGTENIFTQTLYENKSFNIADGKNNPLIDEDFIRLLGTDSFALVPLIYRGIPLGVLLADNFINKKPIHDEDVERLITFANHASLAIENSHLYKSLEGKVEELSTAYNELQENRDKLIRYERLSAVGEVAAKVTHEIRNPMVVIGGFARRILRKDHDGELNRNYVKIIVEEISRMENILTDILYFAKPAVPKCDTVDINRIVRNSIEVLSFETEENNISTEEHLDPNLPMLFIDENQVRRVLINLIRNAIQAMPDGGTITISTVHEGQWVIIETADTGVGISDDDMDKLFDAFFSSKSTGSGLGLTVSAQIINNHGGTIEVQKREPKGTIFKIKLPVNKRPQ